MRIKNRHFELQKVLLKRLAEGTYTDVIPGTRQLATEFDVNGKTVDKAINALVNEGVLYRIKGKGTFVKKAEETESADADQPVTIGVVVPFVGEKSWLFKTLLGIHQRAEAANLTLKFRETRKDFSLERKAVRELLKLGVSGLITLPAGNEAENKALYGRLKLPMIALDRMLEGVTTDHVSADNYRGAFDATNYLQELGHRHIALIMPEAELSSVRARRNGYLAAMKLPDISAAGELIIKTRGNSTIDQSINILRRLQEQTPTPTAIFAMNDGIALSLYAAAMRLGIKIPEDFSLVGFDNADMTEALDLTTMGQPFVDIGRVAVELLENRLQATASNDRVIHKILMPKLIKRGSVQKCIIN